MHVPTATLDGGVGLLLPMQEKTYRRLLMLQNALNTMLPHHAGLNPKAFRFARARSTMLLTLDVFLYSNLHRRASKFILTTRSDPFCILLPECCTVTDAACRTRCETSWMENSSTSTCTSARWSAASWPRRSVPPKT